MTVGGAPTAVFLSCVQLSGSLKSIFFFSEFTPELLGWLDWRPRRFRQPWRRSRTPARRVWPGIRRRGVAPCAGRGARRRARRTTRGAGSGGARARAGGVRCSAWRACPWAGGRQRPRWSVLRTAAHLCAPAPQKQAAGAPCACHDMHRLGVAVALSVPPRRADRRRRAAAVAGVPRVCCDAVQRLGRASRAPASP